MAKCGIREAESNTISIQEHVSREMDLQTVEESAATIAKINKFKERYELHKKV